MNPWIFSVTLQPVPSFLSRIDQLTMVMPDETHKKLGLLPLERERLLNEHGFEWTGKNLRRKRPFLAQGYAINSAHRCRAKRGKTKKWSHK